MKTLAKIALFAFLVLLAACTEIRVNSYADLSIQETAVPLWPERLEVSSHIGSCADLLRLSGYLQNEQEVYRLDVFAKADLGLLPWLDACVKQNYGDSYGAWAGVKALLIHKDKFYLALKPSYSYISDNYRGDYKVKAEGAEAHLLGSYLLGKSAVLTLAGRGSWHHLSFEGHQGDFWQWGVGANIKKEVGIFYYMPELGLGFMRPPDKEWSPLPFVGIGLGVKL
ncbi:MAG: hypothetical protein KBA54_00695 [Candidatus Cloacimonetes bacterium]|nr:hypothetical protein [Candidatus Cloacimonadota bacterium]